MSCWLCRWSLSREQDGAPRGPRTARHVSRCAACAAHERRLVAFADALRRASTAAPLPAGRTGNAMRWPTRAALVAGAAAVTALVALSLADEPAVPEAPPPPRAHATAPAQEQPIPTFAPAEVDKLAADAQDGLQFVLRVSGLRAAPDRSL